MTSPEPVKGEMLPDHSVSADPLGRGVPTLIFDSHGYADVEAYDNAIAERDGLRAENARYLLDREALNDAVSRLRAEVEALKASARVLAGTGSDLTRAVAAATHGDPPDRECLPGSDEKWEGYLLGVEEAAAAAAGWVAGQTALPADEEEASDG